MSDLRELFGTDHIGTFKAAAPAPVVEQKAPELSLKDRQRLILNNRSMKVRDKIQAIRALCQPIR